ncbi:hypothetical protein GCE86_08805 [Micromonospora terminaliae]|uniref:Uncharacterized protein n=1 Tax=Micromonospora terminaliae TaxID=1914461 RepID=A0AAJ3DJA7_9ACTN|nr:hypothetical protein [Micromonospora terminaliae]NES28113.1 hypothetical protein [Micromonospora terminaliae]QGL47141.1 hypothetical protein GCE86_08805 [Micromonospora terminaliae]
MTGEHRPDQFADVARYVRSAEYEADLAACRAVWSTPGVVETAGSFVLLTYFANPTLLAVRAAGPTASLRTAIDGHREREFLNGIIGLGAGGPGNAGIRDEKVMRRAERLREAHLQYPGMTVPYMHFIGGLLAIAPLRLRAHRDEQLSPAVGERYWCYITNVMRLLAANLATVPATERSCREFDQSTAGPSPEGEELIRAFSGRHPRHVAQAMPMLFPASRRVVDGALDRLNDRVRVSRSFG